MTLAVTITERKAQEQNAESQYIPLPR